MAEWVKEIKASSSIDKADPHHAYSVYTHGIRQLWTSQMAHIHDISLLLLPMENAVKNVFVSAPVKPYVLRREGEVECSSDPSKTGRDGDLKPQEAGWYGELNMH